MARFRGKSAPRIIHRTSFSSFLVWLQKIFLKPVTPSQHFFSLVSLQTVPVSKKGSAKNPISSSRESEREPVRGQWQMGIGEMQHRLVGGPAKECRPMRRRSIALHCSTYTGMAAFSSSSTASRSLRNSTMARHALFTAVDAGLRNAYRGSLAFFGMRGGPSTSFGLTVCECRERFYCLM